MSDDEDGKIPYEIYQRGVICPGSGSLLFPPDPEFPEERGVCFRCSCSIAVINDHHLDSHMVLPELIRPNPWEEVLDDGDTTDGGS